MTNDTQHTPAPSAPTENEAHATPEPRFPRAAVRYIDALLDIQRQRFEQELTLRGGAEGGWDQLKSHLSLPQDCHYLAEGDSFIGTGWSALGHRRDGTAFRWMGRIGTLLMPLTFEAGADIQIQGCGFTRRRHLKGLTIWLDQEPVVGTIARKGFNRWSFSGRVAPMPWRPYRILRLQSPGMSRLAVGLETFVSVAVSSVTVRGLGDQD